jgi:hypothetical protein
VDEFYPPRLLKVLFMPGREEYSYYDCMICMKKTYRRGVVICQSSCFKMRAHGFILVKSDMNICPWMQPQTNNFYFFLISSVQNNSMMEAKASEVGTTLVPH